MAAITLSDAVSIGSLAVAALALVSTMLSAKFRDKGDDAAREQRVDDKLDHISDMSRETRDTVRDIQRKLDDHGERLVKVESDVETLYRRVSRIERNIDVRFNPEQSN